MNGHGKEVFKYFEQMFAEGVQPDNTTFICLLSACYHGCLVDEGINCYTSMVTDCIISAKLVDEGIHCYCSMVTDCMICAKLKHYTCMLDHAGHVQEVENMVMAMPW